MPYLSLSELQKRKRLSFDFIVVGAGSAGCPLASRLSEDLSVTVLLVEAGSKEPKALEEKINRAIPAACSKLQMTGLSWDYYTEPPEGEESCREINTNANEHPNKSHQSYWPRGKGIGGCSSINYMAYVRGHANDYNDWESKYDAKGWSWENMQPLFQRMENTAECHSSGICPRCHGTEGPLGVSHKKPTCSVASAFVASAQALDFPTGDYNCFCTASSISSKKDGVVSMHQQTVRQGTRCNAGRAYIAPLLSHGSRRPNLFVVTEALCEKVLTEKNTSSGHVSVSGVQLKSDGSTSTFVDIFASKEVILSAGALASPQILLQSGIGPKGSVLDIPQVGQHLQDHLFTFMRFSPRLGQGKQDIGSINATKAEGPLSALPNMIQMLLNSVGMLTSSAYDASLFYPSKPGLPYPDLQIGLFCAGGDRVLFERNLGINLDPFKLDEREMGPSAEGLVMACTLLHPKSYGYLELADDSNYNYGIKIHANYLTDKGDEDLKCSVQLMRTSLQLAKKGPLGELIAELPLLPKDLCTKYNITEESKAEDVPDDFLEEYIRRYATTLYHPVGTCRIGKDKSQGVVDHKLRVFGVQNLRVADASVQPEIVSGNTNASCIAIGERAADIIREDHGLKANQDDLIDAVNKYEKSILWNRYKLISGAITALSLGLAAVVTAAFWKSHGAALW